MNNPIFQYQNNLNPAPFGLEVNQDEMGQYIITLSLLGKKFSRIEKSKDRAVNLSRDMINALERVFQYTWEDNS